MADRVSHAEEVADGVRKHSTYLVALPMALADSPLSADLVTGRIERRGMKLKKFGATLVVLCALGAVTASSALAAAVTQDATWRVGSTGAVLTGSETVAATGSGEMVTTIGETPLIFKFTGLNCVECKIENSGGTAVGGGKLEFTGVTLPSQGTCAVSGGKVTTLALKINADYMGGAGSGDMWLFQPASGTTWATIGVVSGSGACPINGSYVFSGNLFARSNNATGIYAASQTITSNGSINVEGGGELKFGSKAFEINGADTFALSGANKGVVFGTHE